MSESDLLGEFRRELSKPAQAAAPSAPKAFAPRGFEPGVQYVNDRPDTITTGPVTVPLEDAKDYAEAVNSMGITLPEGYTLRLVEARYDGASWTRENPGDPATTQPVWRYKFRVEAVFGGEDDLDLAAMMEEAKKDRPKIIPPSNEKTTMVVVMGDIQAGKQDVRGGTLELLKRLEVAKAQVIEQVSKIGPAELVLLDVGDSVEMFESSPNAERTNDLQATEQIRVWRRVFWSWIKDLSNLAPDVKVLSVPSNHCAVRRGKSYLSTPSDDWGIEVLSQCADIAAENPNRYSHVKFFSPDTHSESLALALLGGKVLGAAHGHQKRNPTQFSTYLAGQALGRTPIGSADITVFGHFHNLRVETIGDDRWFFVAPTIDSGSSWFSNLTGNESRAGVLTFVVDEQGWRDLFVAWSD